MIQVHLHCVCIVCCADTVSHRKHQVLLVTGDGKWFEIGWMETDEYWSESGCYFQCILIHENGSGTIHRRKTVAIKGV
jgi:hypothetical protein